MTKFFSSDVLELQKKYKEKSDYTKATFLRELVSTAFENGGTLPDSFDIHLKCMDIKSVVEVFKDVGCDPDNYKIFSGAETICVSSK